MAPVIRILPEWQCWPTWDHEVGEPIDANALGLPPELVARVVAWDERFQSTFDADYPPDSAFATPEAESAWRAEGDAIVEAIRARGLVVIDRR
jgi:hypothetical protein